VATDGLKNVHIVQGDLDSHESLNAAAKKTAELTGGAVDVLIVNGAYFALDVNFSNAGGFVGKEAVVDKEMTQIMHTNVTGTIFAFNAFMPLVLKSKIKKVIGISSGACIPDIILKCETEEGILYAASKAAMNVVVSKYAVQYKKDDVKFLSLSPGFVDTFTEKNCEFICVGSLPAYMSFKLTAVLLNSSERPPGTTCRTAAAMGSDMQGPDSD